MAFNFTDFYIKYKGHPLYNDREVTEDEIVKVIVQKIEMILFTMKGEVLGDPDFGGDLYNYLHSTRVSADYVEEELTSQFNTYIPELIEIGYTLNVTFSENPNEYSDMMFIDITFKEFEVNAYFI